MMPERLSTVETSSALTTGRWSVGSAGNVRRGTVNDANVYSVIVNDRDSERFPVYPWPLRKPVEVFTSLCFENFKTSGMREIAFDCISTVSGNFGMPRSQVFSALWLLHVIAKGKDATITPARWFGTEWPTVVSISYRPLRGIELKYSVTLQRIDEKRIRVIGERVEQGNETILLRRKHSYILAATKDKYGIGSSAFALYDAAHVLGGGNPIAELKRYLGDLWLLDPDPIRMKSEIVLDKIAADDPTFANLAACMVIQQQTNPSIAIAVTDAVRGVNPDITGYSVGRNAKGIPFLAIHHRSDMDISGTPFGLIDNSEKILFLVAFVCTMNERSAPIPAVWLSPFNWLGEQERTAAERLVRTSFAKRGQMIMLV